MRSNPTHTTRARLATLVVGLTAATGVGVAWAAPHLGSFTAPEATHAAAPTTASSASSAAVAAPTKAVAGPRSATTSRTSTPSATTTTPSRSSTTSSSTPTSTSSAPAAKSPARSTPRPATTQVPGANLSAVGAAAAPRAGWPAPTTVVSSQTQLVSAINAAKPGDVIGLTAGTYSGALKFTRSGTATAPITLRPVGNDLVTLTASLSMPSCGATGPDPNRTIRFSKGASYWNILGLKIRGGAIIATENAQFVQNWLEKQFDSENWQARRAIPGHSTYDLAADASMPNYLARTVGKTLAVSRGIKFIGNTFTVKGIQARMAQTGSFSYNTMSDIACGTGPGVWLSLFSDGWQVSHNDISRIAHSTASHYMQEGIRVANGSSYNVISDNFIHDLADGGRAFTGDQDASFNTYAKNTARSVDIGFNDEMSGWGNNWHHNLAANYATTGFSLRMMDGRLSTPSMNSGTRQVSMRCNIAATNRGFQAGSLAHGVVSGNQFSDVFVSSNLRVYSAREGNVWDGTSKVPDNHTSTSLGSEC